MLNECKTRPLILQIAILITALTAQAQTPQKVKGNVSSEGSAIIGAYVQSNSDNKVLGYTDIIGNFSVETIDSLIQIVMPGYDTAIVGISREPINIELVKRTDLLDQVVVSESRSVKTLKESTVSLDIIQPRLLELTAPTTIRHSIDRVNGVQIVDGQANIRSGSGWSYGAGSRVQVLVNGLPMLSGDASQALWSFIPTEGIEKVEIIKGAASVIYGSSALNGVINIHTKTSSNDPITNVSLSTGFFSTPKRAGLDYGQGKPNISNVSAFHLGKIGELDFSLGMNMLYDAGFKMNDYERRARTSIGLRKMWPEKNMVFGLSTSYQRGVNASFLLWDSYHRGYSSLDSGLTETNNTRFHLDPYWIWYKNGWKQEVKARYLNVSNDVDNGDTSTDQSNFSNLAYAEYQVNKKFNNGWLVIGGIVGQWSKTKSPLFSGEQNTSNSAAYVQVEKRIGKLLINTGVRYERFTLNDREESKPVVRAGLNYQIAAYSFLRASFGQGFRFPSVAETFITTSVGPVVIYPNESLKSETGYNIELGFKQGYKIKTIQGFIDIALYEMRFENMTEFTFAQWESPFSKNFGIGFKSVNTGPALIQGLEISTTLRGEIEEFGIQGFIGYNYTYTEALEPMALMGTSFADEELNYLNTSSNPSSGYLKYRPLHQFKTDLIIEWKRLYIGGGLTFQSEIENIDTAFVSGLISAIIPGVDTAMNEELTKFLIVNFRLGYTFYEYLQVNIIASNVFNREFMIRPADLGEPRSIRLQISYTFK